MFRRVRSYEIDKLKDLPHFGPTDMGKCPLIVRKKKTLKGYKYDISDKLEQIFEKGSHIHVLEGVKRAGSRNFVDKEFKMRMIDMNETFVFTGYSDFIMFYEHGLYIEDLKTCDLKAFYHFLKEKGAWNETIQVSCYNLLYYVIFGVNINKGVITKIDRDNTLNRISFEIPIYSLQATIDFIIEHPSINIILGKITETEFMKRAETIIRKTRWQCRYCMEKKECPINIKLTKEERAKKLKKKKQKELFESLLEDDITQKRFKNMKGGIE